MTAPKQQQTLDFYLALMEEIKLRIAAVESVLCGRVEGFPTQIKVDAFPPFLREFCFFHFRAICELVACACVVAHGTLPVAKLKKEYRADRIVNMLEKMHANFYPKPVKMTITSGHVHLDDVTGDFLTKKELVDLCHKSGSYLHRSFKNLEKTKQPVEVDYEEIHGILKKVVTLLSQHIIFSHDRSHYILCALSVADAGGNVQVSFAEAPRAAASVIVASPAVPQTISLPAPVRR